MEIVDALIEHYGALRAILDAFGDDAAPRDPSHVHQRAQDFRPHGIALDPGDEVAIHLDVIGAHFRPGFQPRRARPQIIDGDVASERAQRPHRGGDPALVLRSVLGNLQHHIVRVDMLRRERIGEPVGERATAAQRLRQQVEEQSPLEREAVVTAQRRLDAGPVELDREARLLSAGDEHGGRFVLGAGRAARDQSAGTTSMR